MGLFNKSMYKYELFERIRINLNKEQEKQHVELEKVFENQYYNLLPMNVVSF